jgi:hypothetical protein
MKVEYRTQFDTDAVVGSPTVRADVTGLENNEPIFVVRARDALALPFLAFYAALAEQADLFDSARTAQIRGDMQAFVSWRRANMALVRDPD